MDSFFWKIFDFTEIWFECTLLKLRKFTLTHFWQKSRESNGLLKKLLNSWFDEIFHFSILWNENHNFIISLVKISWNQYPFDQLVKEVNFTEFWSNYCDALRLLRIHENKVLKSSVKSGYFVIFTKDWKIGQIFQLFNGISKCF